MADAEAGQKKQKEAQSQEWIDKFSPFLDPNNDSYLLIGSNFNSASKEDQEKCRQGYPRANSLMVEYQKTEFPYDKTQELLFMEPRLLDKLRHYNEGQAKAKQREACKGWVEKLRVYVEPGAGSRKYLIAGITASEAQIKEQEALFKEAQIVWSDYQKAEFPLGKTSQLVQLEKEMRERLAEMPEVLRKSQALLAGDLEGEVDRVLAHLNKDTGWKDDTSKTTARYRITKSMTAQAAAKGNDGKVYLHSVHLASDRKSDGSWGPLYGHIMWSDWIAEENVNK